MTFIWFTEQINTWKETVHALPFCDCFNQVSAVTDHVGVQVGGATTGDLDDDEGGGLVGKTLFGILFNMSDIL